MPSIPRIAGKFARYVAPANFESHLESLSQSQRNARYFVNDLSSIGAHNSVWNAATLADKPFVNLYQSSLFRPINTYLRQGDEGLIALAKATGTRGARIHPEGRLDVAQKAINIIPDIQEELTSLRAYEDDWVHRGIAVTDGSKWLQKMGYRKGAIVSDPAFVSSSTDLAMARTFANQNRPSKEYIQDAMDEYDRYYQRNWLSPGLKSRPDFSSVLVSINQPKTGRIMPTGLVNQKEVLFQPNTQFCVEDIMAPSGDDPRYHQWTAFLREV